MRLRRFAFVCAIGACTLAACGNNNLLGSTTATQSAIRFINGSPDLGAVDIYLNGTGNAASNTALAYKSATTLAYVNSQSYTVTVTPTASKTTSVACGTPSLAANTRYTIVIAGKVAAGAGTATGLQCQIFAETIYSLPAGEFQLAFHNASPALNAASPSGAGFGLFSNSAPPVYQNEAGVALFTAATSSVANGAAFNALVPGVEVPPGTGVYASTVLGTDGHPNPPAAANVQATLLPSQLQIGYITAVSTACPDAGNFYPIQTPSPTPTPASTTPPTPSPTPSPACTAVSNVMSVYAVDAPTGSSTTSVLVGVSD